MVNDDDWMAAPAPAGVAPAAGLGLVPRCFMYEAVAAFLLALLGSQSEGFVAGLLVAALTFTASAASQAHFSPAITAAYACLGAITPLQAVAYICSHIVGGVFGSLTAAGLFGVDSALENSPFELAPLSATSAAALVLPTVLYALVHLSVLSEGKRTQFYGLAVGFALYAGVVAHGESAQSCCLLNPALPIANWLSKYLLGATSSSSSSSLVLLRDAATSSPAIAWPILNLAAFLVLLMLVGGLSALLFDACNGEGRLAVLSTEFVGTFLFVYLVVATADEGRESSAQAVGLGLASLTYFGAEISEAHYNPMISLAHAISGGLGRNDVAPFLGVQLVACVLATYCTSSLLGEQLPKQSLSLPYAISEIREAELTSSSGLQALMCSLLIAFVHLSVLNAQGKSAKADANGFFGYAIGARARGCVCIMEPA